MSVLLGTLCLNEMEWLPRIYAQHKDWPGLRKWVFVESADRAYQAANPLMVSADGLSVDGTTEWLEQLARTDDRVLHVKYGFCSDVDPALAKVSARNVYLEEADKIQPTYLITLDADESYTARHQELIHEYYTSAANRLVLGTMFQRRDIWRPPSIADRPLFDLEVVGGFWGIPCCHSWRWLKGMRYRGNHNNPKQAAGRLIPFIDLRSTLNHVPQLIHLGFAASERTRLAKNNYYARRGEAVDPKRAWYVHSRSQWAAWKPGEELPRGAKVVRYTGPVPEVFPD